MAGQGRGGSGYKCFARKSQLEETNASAQNDLVSRGSLIVVDNEGRQHEAGAGQMCYASMRRQYLERVYCATAMFPDEVNLEGDFQIDKKRGLV